MKMKKKTYLIAALVAMVLMSSQSASADVTAVYKMTSRDGTGSQTIKYADKQHVRIDMTNGINQKVSMLRVGNKVYSINGKVVQDMSQLSKLMAAMGRGKKGSHKKSSVIKYKDTGKTETIAGIKGKVYRFVDNGKQHEIVLGRSKDLQNAVLGLINIMKSASSMKPDDAMKRMQQSTSIKNMAMLRLDNAVRLQSIKTTSIPASTFKLPAAPQQMKGLGNLMKGILGK